MLYCYLLLFLNNLQLKSIFTIFLFSSKISLRILHPSSFKIIPNFYFYNYLPLKLISFRNLFLIKDSFKQTTPFDVILLPLLFLYSLPPKSSFSIFLFSSKISLRILNPSSFKSFPNFYFL
jgi:hypothetical protein